MIEIINESATVWLNYFGLAVLQNTIFLGIVFLAFCLFRNESAQVKYGIALIGLIKLLIPPFIPDRLLNIFGTSPTPQPTVKIGNIIPVLAAESQSAQISLTSLLLGIWILAAAGYLLVALISTLILKYRLNKAQIISTEIRDNKVFMLYQTALATVPMSVGIFPQKIFLPANWKKLPKDCRQVLLEHEIAHLKRKDGIAQFFQIVVQALYFFHPLVWLLNERLNEYREMACDDEAVNRAQLSPTKYSRYLVSLAEKVVNPQWSHTSASALIKQRNKLLNRVNYQIKEKTMNQSKKKIFIFLAGLLILMLPMSFYNCAEKPVSESPELSENLMAAERTGKIYGTIVDKKTNEPIPAANVVLTGTTQGAATDEKGNFVILNVPPGAYQLKVAMMGYKQVLMNDVRVVVGKSTKTDFKLEVGVIDMGTQNLSDTAPPPPPPKKGEAQIFVAYDKAPEPIGGFEAIQKNLIYPEKSRKEGREGIVYLKILINEKGDITDVELLKATPREGMDPAKESTLPDDAMIESAIKAVKSSKWIPGQQRDKSVKVWIAVPITFGLD